VLIHHFLDSFPQGLALMMEESSQTSSDASAQYLETVLQENQLSIIVGSINREVEVFSSNRRHIAEHTHTHTLSLGILTIGWHLDLNEFYQIIGRDSLFGHGPYDPLPQRLPTPPREENDEGKRVVREVLPNNERDYDRSFESSLRTTWTKLSIREIETICRAGVRQYHDTKEQ
jgi:hypothetical protein